MVSQQKLELWDPVNLEDIGIPPPLYPSEHELWTGRLSSRSDEGLRVADALAGSGAEVQARQAEESHPDEVEQKTTLIVNAAVMATSYVKGASKRFNKPIFVDLVLPV